MKVRDATFRAGEDTALRAAKRALVADIKRTKATHRQIIWGHFSLSDPRRM